MRNWTPWFIKGDRFLDFLSFFAPITIGAITLGVMVIYRGEMDEQTRRHETIHFQQYLETLFFGFLLIYVFDWLWNLVKYRDGAKAYMMLRAEQEAYAFDEDESYLSARKRWRWLFRRL